MGRWAPENQAMNRIDHRLRRPGCPSSDAPRCAGLGRSGQTVSKEAWSDQAHGAGHGGMASETMASVVPKMRTSVELVASAGTS